MQVQLRENGEDPNSILMEELSKKETEPEESLENITA